jgi:hypothetical protein
MQLVPVLAVPSQTLTITLGGQACTIAIYQKSTGLFLDLAVSNTPIISGVLCLHTVLIVRDAYLGFIGDLAFLDQQAADDPVYTGLGSRWVLGYMQPWQFIAA